MWQILMPEGLWVCVRVQSCVEYNDVLEFKEP